MMTVIGMHRSANSKGERVTTLHVSEEFEPYYTDRATGRSCEGKKVSTIYVGTYDCSSIEIGSEIEVYYNKAIVSSKGTFQTIKHIEVM